MGVNIKGRSYLKLLDYTSEEIRYLLDLSKQFRRNRPLPSTFAVGVGIWQKQPSPADDQFFGGIDPFHHLLGDWLADGLDIPPFWGIQLEGFPHALRQDSIPSRVRRRPPAS